MFDEPVDRDDEDEDVTVSPPIPEAYVTAHLHGGPHDGETDGPMPWAMLKIPKLDWDTDETVWYRLRGPWLGQADAHYEYVTVVAPKATSQRNATERRVRIRAQWSWLVLLAFVAGFLAGHR